MWDGTPRRMQPTMLYGRSVLVCWTPYQQTEYCTAANGRRVPLEDAEHAFCAISLASAARGVSVHRATPVSTRQSRLGHDVIFRRTLRGRIDPKDGVIRRNRFESGYRSVVRDRQVPAATRGNLAPGLENRRALLWRNFS
jgi:hypothetical protein